MNVNYLRPELFVSIKPNVQKVNENYLNIVNNNSWAIMKHVSNVSEGVKLIFSPLLFILFIIFIPRNWFFSVEKNRVIVSLAD